ncbi:translocation protein TolB [Paenibacillus mesophilus]|uniref:PD40 domain-containing protein n=1 Tax=Paenibacillus mesophilus TaxID=2582849 RepID=UPI00110F5F63|nr:PD40 domain-containing protein [Paenibacillus mesophilus]TMV48395.1 translocation protein TolB [Paenibacillus mesophilus]
MNKTIWSVMLLLISLWTGGICSAEADRAEFVLKAAFIRNGDLWLKLNGADEQPVTKDGKAAAPKWSHDGKFVAYAAGEQANDIWVYSLESKRQLHVYSGGANYEWAPDKNRLAFQIDGILNYADVSPEQVDPFVNVTPGISNYSWLPNGNGFLVSSSAQLLPTGWTDVKLYLVPADANMDPGKAKLLFTLPPQSGSFFAVGTSGFKWSPDGKWISFLAIPTASLSADSNTLCVLSSDGKTFRKVDEMLHYEEWFDWAPGQNMLAYIGGIGRFAIENKQLRIKEFPVIQRVPYTPKGYADRGFTWEGDRFITVSRSKESEWSNDAALRPLPALYRIDIHRNDQKQITSPPDHNGDFQPTYLAAGKKLAWVRSDRERADAWISNGDGSEAVQVISDIDVPSPYYDAWHWDSVLAWYAPGR